MSRVIVFGSINLDLTSQVVGHPVPGETVLGSNYNMLAGGKGGNQAFGASKLKDVEVIMVGAVGEDVFSKPAIANLKTQNVNLDNIKSVTDVGTGVAFIAVDAKGENTIIVTPGANHMALAEQLNEVMLSTNDVLLTQNELKASELFSAHELARENGCSIVHNAAPAHTLSEQNLQNIDFLILNESEAKSIANGFSLQDLSYSSLAAHLASISKSKLIVTLGAKGALLFEGEEETLVEAKQVKVVDTTGAGDAFCGVFAAALSRGDAPKAALAMAIEAGSLACERLGAQN